MRLVFQPIVALREAVVVGYEALARFDGPAGLTPDRWFAAADRLGVGAALEALVVERCLGLRDRLPTDCFLSLNVSPHLLGEPELAGLLLGAGDLRPLVLELTEHEQADLRPLVALCRRLTRAGALVALDDAGSGYAGLQAIAAVRPGLIKLDRTLVQDAQDDEVKLALAELLGHFAGRLDAWLLAEGVETWGELEAFLRLGTPLAQGYLLGRPTEPWAQLAPQTAARLRTCAARESLGEHVASLVEVVPVVGRELVRPGMLGLLLDDAGAPRAVLIPERRAEDDPQRHRHAPVSLQVPSSALVTELAHRMIARPLHCRFDPAVCVDNLGRAVGVVRLERVLARLADAQANG